MAKKNQVPPKNFEEALAELEQILGQIEAGECGLEESLVKYERGTFLIQHCRTVLNAAEQQIELLTKGEGGTVQGTPMQMPGQGQAGTGEMTNDQASMTNK